MSKVHVGSPISRLVLNDCATGAIGSLEVCVVGLKSEVCDWWSACDQVFREIGLT